MSYPPSWRVVAEPAFAVRFLRAHPFAQLVTARERLEVTRVPFVADLEGDRPVRLRAHLNAQNPQAIGLDGSPVLVVFSGPATYVSPHWRANRTRAGTYDYEEVQVRGVARVIDDLGMFRQLVDDLSQLIEPQYADVGDYPVWRTSMAPPGYVERLFPHVTCFAVEIETIRSVSKLHQQFPHEDRLAVAEHLGRCPREDSRAIAARIRESMTGPARSE